VPTPPDGPPATPGPDPGAPALAHERRSPQPDDPGFDAWIAARYAIDRLRQGCGGSRRLGPGDEATASADLDLVTTRPTRGGAWWQMDNPVELEHEPIWDVLRPTALRAAAGADTRSVSAVLAAGTRLRVVARTDRYWTRVVYEQREELLIDILDGPLAGGQCVAVQESPSDAGTGLAGQLITGPVADPAAFAAMVLGAGLPLAIEAARFER
jgi:hypothetical protein